MTPFLQNLRPEAVLQSSPLFQPYAKNFKANYARLRSKIVGNRANIDFDNEAFRQEQLAFPRPILTNRGYPFWGGSRAEQLLRAELVVAQNQMIEEVEKMQPMDLYNGAHRAEYHKFPLEIFRNHFYKARTSLRGDVYWQVKRNQKGRKQHAKDAVEETKAG